MKTKNSFGLLLKHLRLDLQEVIITMSEKLEISPAYLSSIETGSRPVPEDFIPKLQALYNLDPEIVQKLMLAKVEQNKEVVIKVTEETSKEALETAVLFSENFQNFTADQLKELKMKLEQNIKTNMEAEM